MKSAYMVVAMLLGASASLTEYKSDAELDQLELRNFYRQEDLEELRMKEAAELVKESKDFECDLKKMTRDQKVNCVDIKQDRLQNSMHLEHRMELWEEKMAKVEELKSLIDASPELVDEQMIMTAQNAKMQVRRSMKYDIDSFMAREALLAEREHAHFYGEDDMELMNFNVEYDIGTETIFDEREHEEVYGADDLELMDF